MPAAKRYDVDHRAPAVAGALDVLDDRAVELARPARPGPGARRRRAARPGRAARSAGAISEPNGAELVAREVVVERRDLGRLDGEDGLDRLAVGRAVERDRPAHRDADRADPLRRRRRAASAGSCTAPTKSRFSSGPKDSRPAPGLALAVLADVVQQHAVARRRGGPWWREEVHVAVVDRHAPGDVAEPVPHPAVHEHDRRLGPVAVRRDEPALDADAVGGLERDVLVGQADLGGRARDRARGGRRASVASASAGAGSCGRPNQNSALAASLGGDRSYFRCMDRVVIAAGARTPIGKFNGALAQGRRRRARRARGAGRAGPHGARARLHRGGQRAAGGQRAEPGPPGGAAGRRASARCPGSRSTTCAWRR